MAKSSPSSTPLDADLLRRAAEILKQPPSAPLDEVIVPRGLWEQIANRLETAASETREKPADPSGDLMILRMALGNTAACLGDALATYNRFVGEEVFKNAAPQVPAMATSGSEGENAADGGGEVAIQRPVDTPAVAAHETTPSATPCITPHCIPMAWIEHHKGGDNLVWEKSPLRCTPLYAHPNHLAELNAWRDAWCDSLPERAVVEFDSIVERKS